MSPKRDERQRYIRFRIHSAEPINASDRELANVIWEQVSRLFGEVLSGKTGLWIMDYDPASQEGILRCSHLTLKEIVAAMTLVTSVNKVQVSIDTFKTSGIIARVKNA